MLTVNPATNTNDHLYGPTLLERIVGAVERYPGLNAWQLREAAGLRKGGERNEGGELVRRVLIRAERAGLVTSLKCAGKRIWFRSWPGSA